MDIVERLEKRASQAGMLLSDPPAPSPDMTLCTEAATLIASQAARIRELEEVYDAARGLCYGEDWNNGTHAKSRGYRQKLVAAVNAIEPLPPLLSRKGGE